MIQLRKETMSLMNLSQKSSQLMLPKHRKMIGRNMLMIRPKWLASCLQIRLPNFKKTFEFHEAFEMIEKLRVAEKEMFKSLNAFIGCKMAKGSFVSAHVLKMKAYVEQLARLGFPFGDELATDESSISELHNMLKNVEANIKKSGNKQVLMIREGQISKKKIGNNTSKGKGKAAKKGNGKGKVKGKPPSTNPTPKPKHAADADYFHCNEKGHWKRNHPKYL
uniref:Uncharacterized protein n=1 Tax=Lactuca sativa TaxID=4236 RepID=A0A9R1VPT2_LACSA|nr:hypothetical protein LSAT_V11C400175930 [Lactuca sativa]